MYSFRATRTPRIVEDPPASDDDALVSDVSSFKVLMAIIRRCIKALEVYRLMY